MRPRGGHQSMLPSVTSAPLSTFWDSGHVEARSARAATSPMNSENARPASVLARGDGICALTDTPRACSLGASSRHARPASGAATTTRRAPLEASSATCCVTSSASARGPAGCRSETAPPAWVVPSSPEKSCASTEESSELLAPDGATCTSSSKTSTPRALADTTTCASMRSRTHAAWRLPEVLTMVTSVSRERPARSSRWMRGMLGKPATTNVGSAAAPRARRAVIAPMASLSST